MAALPGKLDFTIKQNSEFELIFEVYDVFIEVGSSDNVPTDLTGKSAELQARIKKHSTDTVIDVQTASAQLSIPTPADGQIVFSLTSEETLALDFKCANYDLVIFTDEDDRDVLIEGHITLDYATAR